MGGEGGCRTSLYVFLRRRRSTVINIDVRTFLFVYNYRPPLVCSRDDGPPSACGTGHLVVSARVSVASARAGF